MSPFWKLGGVYIANKTRVEMKCEKTYSDAPSSHMEHCQED
jgi:hypothetical protein